MFGAEGLFGATGGGSKEFGSSTATATIEGDTTGVQVDWKLLAVIGGATVLLLLGAIGLFWMLKGK